jgi:phage repressor protein C with HTH and peptisase S24 domain
VSEFEPTLREVLAAGHTARFRASGDSMYPAIRSGDYLEIAPCDVSQLRLGDVILAMTERGLTAHRIVRIRDAEGGVPIRP